MVSVEAIGLVADGSDALNRLYLPGRDAFLQLHLAGSGEPDECRYFSKIDEVAPSSQDEWGFWLDPAEGMIGWPPVPDQGREDLRPCLGSRQQSHRA